MMHPWVRLHDWANTLGLMLSAAALYLTGIQFQNNYIKIASFIALIIFAFLFLIISNLLLRDYFKLYPKLTRRFLGISFIRY